ncbi:MAG TPA: alpha/beta fold hydrolase [Casimicrobiaceae bacterium]|nr:alpha/beta fold hydrolase [Casimicrobiaceae bacterium]
MRVPLEDDVEARSYNITARDGYSLGATLFRSRTATDVDRIAIFNTGGGLAARRYVHFHHHLAAGGLPVVAYDYRGVGASRPVRLRGFTAGLEDWADLDQAGVIDDTLARFPGAPIATISHSVGCLVACAAPNAGRIARMVCIGPHTGYWRDYATRWKVPMALVWHLLMPFTARAVGYFPGSSLALGDDLPRRFALQWAARTTPALRIERGDPEHARLAQLVENARELNVPMTVLSFSDDAFASDAGVNRFIGLVPNAAITHRRLDARDAAGRRIGHFGFFSRRQRKLWDVVLRSATD